MIFPLLASTLRVSTPLLFAALGGLFSERAGVVNIALEGLMLAGALGAAVELHFLSAPLDVLFERISQRGLEKPPIEREALSRWLNVFQEPTPDEMELFDKPLIADLPG